MPIKGDYKGDKGNKGGGKSDGKKGKDDTDKGGKKGGGKKDNKGKGGKGAKDGGTQGPRKINGKTLPCVRFALGRECPYSDKCLLPHCKDGNHVPTDAHPAGTDMNTICQISDIPCKWHGLGKCSRGDECQLSHTAPQPKTKPRLKPAMICAKPADNEDKWILDTGTVRDVCGDDGKTGKKVPSKNPIQLTTGGGVVDADYDIEVFLEALNENIAATALQKGAPKALAVGQRCAQLGYEFHWKPFAQVPICRLPNRDKLNVYCNDFVPYISSMQT